jgi:hypothetical protein
MLFPKMMGPGCIATAKILVLSSSPSSIPLTLTIELPEKP